ncbi:MAG: GDP-mannose 4,6-dehydratase, partial [Otoolea sp.]
MELFEFYKGKRVLLTGHTGFKGAWLTRILLLAGAKVTGYGLEPPTDPSLFGILQLGKVLGEDHVIGDVRDLAHLKEVFDRVQPEIVFHLAAQPIVRESYRNPVGTYETNVMGTVHVLECIRLCPSVRSFVNVTTDKVYENKEWEYG